MGFDPDEFLKSPAPQGQKAAVGSFDPDAFLGMKAEQSKDQSYFGPGGKVPEWLANHPTLSTLVRGTTGLLPMGGAIAGGAAGATLGAAESAPTLGTMAIPLAGMNAVAGAGLGNGLGKGAELAANREILGDDKSLDEAGSDVGSAVNSGALAQGAGEALGAGAKMAAGTKVGQKAIGMAGKAAAKVGETFTGIPAKVIGTFAKNEGAIGDMAKSSAGDEAEAADQIRNNTMDSIKRFKGEQNDAISNTLKDADPSLRHDVTPITDTLEAQKARYNPNANPGAINSIDDLIAKVKAHTPGSSSSGATGSIVDNTVSSTDLNRIRTMMQDEAQGAYARPGEIFNRSSPSATAAKAGGATTREMLNIAHPEIAGANANLSSLHDFEDSMNQNLLAADKPHAALMAAGSGGNARASSQLGKLGNLIGEDLVTPAENLNAMRTFNNPGLMPVDSTGKAVGRMGLAGGLGFLAGGPAGAVGAAALTSPAALKVAIQGGKAVGNAAMTTGGRQLIGQAVNNYAGSPADWMKGDQPDQPSPNDGAAISISDSDINKASQFLMQSPQMQAFAKSNPPAFQSMAKSLAERSGGQRSELDRDSSRSSLYKTPSQAPEDQSTSQSKFIQGN
jgi:hypothetical protein